MYMPPSSGKRRDRPAMVTADGRKKKIAATIHRTNEPGPACAAAATHLRLMMAQMSKKTRSLSRSSRLSSATPGPPARGRVAFGHHLIKGSQQFLAAGIRTGSVGTRLNTQLREFDNVPVLAVRYVPELDGVVRDEIRFRQFGWMEIPFADDFSAVHGSRPQRVNHHVIRMQAQQQIGINDVVADSVA